MNKFFLSLFCSAAIVAATPIKSGVSVSYVDAGNPQLTDSRGVFVGPYTLKVAGVKTPAMCMDDMLTTSGSWSANLTAANSNDLGNTYLGNYSYNVAGTWMTSAQIYQDEAYIFSQIVAPKADRVHLQDAAWTLMDEAFGVRLHSTDSTVNAILSDVSANGKYFDASGYTIISQINGGTNAEQEFMVAAPEPGSLGLLAAALIAFGSFGTWSRKLKSAIGR